MKNMKTNIPSDNGNGKSPISGDLKGKIMQFLFGSARLREDLGKKCTVCVVFGEVTTWDDKMEKMTFEMIMFDYIYLQSSSYLLLEILHVELISKER